MDLPNVVTVQGFKEFNVTQKEQLYDTLLELRVAIEDIPKKSLRKILELTLAVLAYKGEQAEHFHEQLEKKTSEPLNEHLMEENEQLKRNFKALQNEKGRLYKTSKELHDEITILKERLEHVTVRGYLSDKDSSDPLSELDNREELFRNINAKNKHISRLLKEIESLQTQNIELTKKVKELEEKLLHEEESYQTLKVCFDDLEKEKNMIRMSFEDLNIELKRLKGNMTYLEYERERSEKELKKFIEKLENDVKYWKKLLDEKEKEVNNLKKSKCAHSNRENEKSQRKEGEEEERIPSSSSLQQQSFVATIKERDRVIEELENKVKMMAKEMVITTDFMNKVYEERRVQIDSQKSRECCKTVEDALQSANKKAQELAALLEQAEEDNRVKSKQAMNAMSALMAYQEGQDGLASTLEKCSSLERKLYSREKQIQTLIMELNSLNETIHENRLLRKRLNIPDDVKIFTKNLAAKEKNKCKIIQHLNLKLRASEEMRLQLKMEKCDLRKQLLQLKQILPDKDLQLSSKEATENGIDLKISSDREIQEEEEEEEGEEGEETEDEEIEDNDQDSVIEKAKSEENEGEDEDGQDSITLSIDPNIYSNFMKENTLESNKQEMHLSLPSSKEIGEIEDSTNTAESCSSVDNKCKLYEQERNFGRYDDIIRENELLRQGLLEILKKLREYDDSSEVIIIDNTILEELLSALKCPSATVLREQLQVIQQKELALEELLRQEMNCEAETSNDRVLSEIDEIDDVREDGEIKSLDKELCNFIDSTTRPTTPNSQHFVVLPEISETTTTPSTTTFNGNDTVITIVPSKPLGKKIEQDIEELRIYHKYYEELYLHMKSNESEIMQRYAELVEKLKCLEIQAVKEHNKICYLEEDLSQHLNEMKREQIKQFEKEMGWKIENENLKIEIEFIKQQNDHQRTIFCYSKDEFNNLQDAYEECVKKLAYFANELLKDKKRAIQIPNLFADYTVIENDEDYASHIITREEYDKKETLLNAYEMEKLEMLRKISQLESLVELGQEQIKSQQKLLNDITDNHINLRHLVADLQSTNEEKFLIAKLQRDKNKALLEIKDLENEYQNAKDDNRKLQDTLLQKEQLTKKLEKNFQYETRQNITKLRFLEKSLLIMKEKYAKYTPLILVTDYIQAIKIYQNYIEEGNVKNFNCHNIDTEIEELIKTKIDKNLYNSKMAEQQQHLIKLIKSETQCKLFENQVNNLNKRCVDLELQLNALRLNEASETEHWQTIQALFDTEKYLNDLTKKTEKNLKSIQEILTKDVACNTDHSNIEELMLTNSSTQEYGASTLNITDKNETLRTLQWPGKEVQIQTDLQETERSNKAVQTTTNDGNAMKLQLKESMERWQAAEKEVSVIEIFNKKIIHFIYFINRYSESELIIEDLKEKLKVLEIKSKETKDTLQSDVIEKTIMSFHKLLDEKDKSVGKYQNLLQSEREQTHLSLDKLNNEIENLNQTITKLNACIKDKDLEILELKSQLEVLCERRNNHGKLQLATQTESDNIEAMDDNADNSLNEMSDEKIEELFRQEKDSNSAATSMENLLEDNIDDAIDNMEKLNQMKEFVLPLNINKQIKELKEKASFWESNFKIKEDEIQILHEKLKFLHEREKSAQIQTSEIKQLKRSLEEKDKHINELLDTLNNFHDDQKRFINDKSNQTSDQIAQLANDIARTEAANKIYCTQIEALKKQLAAVTQRERQTHDLNVSLRNQLIKRPVVSIKSELNARVKSENLQKRIKQLENDLEDAHAEIQRQKIMLDMKRNRSNLEVGLWEKQKRWQQAAEKYKMKLEETEAALEKTKNLLQTARNTINRLEKEKQMLTCKLGKGNQSSPRHMIKCCRAPSCPNLIQSNNAAIVKYTVSDSPEHTLTGASSPCSSPCRSMALMNTKSNCHTAIEHEPSLMDVLKERLQIQQRKILALELRERPKSCNGITMGMEKIQEKLSAVEAQNARLEAKNLQLQLDIDLLRHGDASDRLHKRIKHLEDYIIALKEEIANMEARRDLCTCNGSKMQTQTGQSAEQTILSLRNLVEKLKSENKYLKDGRHSTESKASTESTSSDIIKLRQLYNDALDKIETLKAELKSKCNNCKLSQNKKEAPNLKEELTYVQELLRKKQQLLQKAKVLLTRAAAKEKVLKEQLTIWKRKCFELQNVPVIEEISE